ncbi:hypothetical protein PHMEG_0005272 [Phytophthora megakarya]|uniref:EML-like second beta-propeller domain-containing protein n=1 Tax=Phytophthora megakarya TaxID=4795 RepID=A0A225WRQ5_9STRA|nr:hypothetical protein PHMEG_0005272 [Phytophthora megakarya]
MLEAMREQMAKVLAEFEDMAANVNSKRSWSNSVVKAAKPFVSPKKTHVHPVVTPLDIIPPAASPKLPKIGGAPLKSSHQYKHNAMGGTLPGPRSPEGKITFDKVLPRVAYMEKRIDGSQVILSQQRQQMYERALMRYPQCRSNIFAPSVYDLDESSSSDTSAVTQAPCASLELEFVYGCRSGTTTSLSSNHPASPNASTNSSAFYLSTGEIMWFTATLVVFITQAPCASLELEFVYGCRSGTTTSLSSSHPASPNASTNSSAFYLSTGEIMWFTATLVVLYKKETNSQRYFREHTSEITSVAVHPNQRIVASGQAGKSAFLLVWNANDEPLGKRFARLKGHQVAVRSISFSHDGKLIASLGGDMYNTICGYGRPETHRSKKPGQSLHDDDTCYTLVSCGVRHIRFWTLTKANYVPPPSKENPDHAFFNSTFGGPPRLRPPTPTEKVWKLEGNVPSFNGRFEVQDFTSLTFVNDSPPIYIYDEESKELVAINATDHSLGRIVAGTAKGDLCLFLQPRASPDINTVSEPAKWWEIPDEYTDAEINELVLEKILYEPTGRLVDVVPHDQETGNRLKLPKQTQVEMEGLTKTMALRPNSTVLHSRLGELNYSGPLAHHGAVYQMAYSKQLNMIMSCGNDGKLLLWKCQMIKPMRIPGVNTQGVFTPLTGTFSEGSHAIVPLDDPTKKFQLPTVLPNEFTAGGKATTPKPTSIVWKDDGKSVLVATSNSCIWELDIAYGEWQMLFEARSGAVATCAAHPSMEEVVTVSYDGYLSFWDLEQHVCKRRLYLGSLITSSIKAFCMEFHPAGYELVIGLSSGELLIVDCEVFKVSQRKSIKPNSSSTSNLHSGLSGPGFRAITKVKYCPNAKYLAVGVKDTFIYIYDVINGYKKLHVCEGHSSAVTHLTWNKESDILLSNAADGEILHWLISPTKGETKQITDAFLVRDVEWINWTCAFGWPTPGIWSEDSPNLIDIAAVCATGAKTINENYESGSFRLRSNENLLAVACRSNLHLLRYPASRGAKRNIYKAHSSAITAMGFSFDDKYLVTVGGDDGTLVQWKVISNDSIVRVSTESNENKAQHLWLSEDSSAPDQARVQCPHRKTTNYDQVSSHHDNNLDNTESVLFNRALMTHTVNKITVENTKRKFCAQIRVKETQQMNIKR